MVKWRAISTNQLTDRRRERALAANTAFDEPAHPKPKRGAAVRVARFVR